MLTNIVTSTSKEVCIYVDYIYKIFQHQRYIYIYIYIWLKYGYVRGETTGKF